MVITAGDGADCMRGHRAQLVVVADVLALGPAGIGHADVGLEGGAEDDVAGVH